MRTWDELGTANKKSGANEANTSEDGIGQRPRPPHEVVQKPGGSSVAPPADVRRCPLAPLKGGKTPYGAEAASRGSNTSLRPYVVPYTDRSTPAVKPAAPPAVKQLGPDDNGVTLRYMLSLLLHFLDRCMYTNQKTKKRKVWSDGAVKCCPKRQRVALYRWSEVLGITDKLLGEIYLSGPEYEAFVTQGEPELEMELYIASLEGVIQNELPSGGGQTDAGSAAQPAGGANGRKRKLLKPFKPPTRSAPSFPPAASAASPMYDRREPPGRMHEGQNGGRCAFGGGGDGRGALPARTSYTGFGQVESLWDDDEQECEDAGGGLGRDNHAGWGNGARGGRSAHGARGREDNAFSEARSEEARAMQSSAAASGSSSRSDVFHGQRGGGEECDSSSRYSHGLQFGETFGDYAEGERGHDGDRAHNSEDRPHAPPYVGGFRGEGGGAVGMPIPTTSSSGWGQHGVVDGRGSRRFAMGEVVDDRDSRRFATDEVVGGRDSRRFATGHVDSPREEGPFGRDTLPDNCFGEDSRREGGPFVRDTLPDNRRGVQRAHESFPEPKGGEGQGQVRSTQDILSLFGGFGETPSGGQNTDSPLRGGGGGMPVAPLQSRGSNEMSPVLARRTCDTETPVDLELESTLGNFVMPVTGKGRAADMRRAQNAARAVEPPVSARFEAGRAAGVVAACAMEASAPLDWECDVCGVRGSPSSKSCRVCGAKRRPRRNGGGGGGGGGGVDSDGGGGGGGGGSGSGSGGGDGGGGDGDGGGGGDGDCDTLDNHRSGANVFDGDQLGGSHSSKGTGWGDGAADEGAENIGVRDYVRSDDMPRRREIDHDDMPLGRKVDHTAGSNLGEALCRGEGAGELSRSPPVCRSFSPSGEEGLGAVGSSASASGAPRKRHIAGVRMQMDFGFSSDSDND